MKNTETLERLCEIVERKIEKCVDALDKGETLDRDNTDHLDKLTHMLKSIKTTMAMEGYGSSERRGRDSMGRYVSRADGYDGGRSEYGYYPMRAWDDGMSHEYGDSRRGSYEGRSMHGEEMKEKLRRMADETDDERVTRALHTAMQQM